MSSRPLMSQVRIIAGQWRGRKIHFQAYPGLRPTPDRIRETLFNWLAPIIQGAHCADLFAGSGALGFEALSRGASQVTWVEANTLILRAIADNVRRLAVDRTKTAWIKGQIPQQVPVLTSAPFDIIFVDPPYHQNLIMPTLQWILTQRYLKSGGLIYFEAEKEWVLDWPQDWMIFRHQRTATLQYGLLRWD